MEVKAGDIVSVRHYSEMNLFKSVIQEVDGDIYKIKLTKQFAALNFLEGDPIVLGLDFNDQLYISSCTLMEVNTKLNIISLKSNHFELLTNKRTVERYPVSYYADIRLEDSLNKFTATVKNMSLNGVAICSKQEFSIEQELFIDIYMDNKVIFFKTEVVWKSCVGDRYEYGMKIMLMDQNNQKLLKNTLEYLKKEQEDFIKYLKG